MPPTRHLQPAQNVHLKPGVCQPQLKAADNARRWHVETGNVVFIL